MKPATSLLSVAGDSVRQTVTIALATAKEAIRQPAFFVLAFLAGSSLICSIFVSYFTFGEDIKMYKDTGLTTISFVSLLLALLTASSAVAEEIEGKTAITLLSKPINRRQFIMGKFIGIELGVLALFVLLGVLFCFGVWYKYAYDLREAAGGEVEALKRWGQVLQVLPGLALGFFEVTVVAAISVAISTRLPMLVNLVVCIAIFFLGHMTPFLVEATSGNQANELVKFMAQLFARVLPSLEFFNASPSIATGAVIPWLGYVLPAFGYCVLYSGAALIFAFLLFENRDVA
ncbi:MAG TPA: ABC transporter permease subunit [Isosphaeraceae bacterium]|jgi:ABC-type transport system involved in multi-copper enzyme maturation permease subunit|nr:ABC transporter permease subunit [Isosphaeraceae bacterium]